jgi:hypothetical protein
MIGSVQTTTGSVDVVVVLLGPVDVVVVDDAWTVVVVAPPGQRLVSTRVQLSTQSRKAPPPDVPGQVTPPKSQPFGPQSHASPGSRTPSPQTDPGRVVVVVVIAQPPLASQASQQLEAWLTHALPPFGARQAAAAGLIEHFLWPLAVTRQQAAVPGRPQVDFAAQWRMAEAHWGASRPCVTATWATAAAQRA